MFMKTLLHQLGSGFCDVGVVFRGPSSSIQYYELSSRWLFVVSDILILNLVQEIDPSKAPARLVMSLPGGYKLTLKQPE